MANKHDPEHRIARENLRRYEPMLALEPRLPAIWEGKARPADAAEQVALAGLCAIKKRYTTAARFYADAFTAEPRLAHDLDAAYSFDAACYAALAACGQGEDTTKLDDKERARLRQQALGWLRANLALWGKQVESGTPKARADARNALARWQKDLDLAGVRDMAALTKLPEAERAEWKKLWADVEALRKKCGEGGNA